MSAVETVEVEGSMSDMETPNEGEPPGPSGGFRGFLSFLCSVGMADGGMRLWVASLDRSPYERRGSIGHIRAVEGGGQ